MLRLPQPVINWHVTEACNYQCKFCYSHWKRPNLSELWRDSEASSALIQSLGEFFIGERGSRERFQRRPRINFAGGEPTLWLEPLMNVVDASTEVGFDVSLISNGSRPEALRAIAPKLGLLGISLDSVQSETNTKIGRLDRRGAQMSISDLTALVAHMRAFNPAIKIKINTVVNSENADEDFRPLITALAPERWKILRMLPSYTDALAVSDTTFERFVARHRSAKTELSIEDNNHMVRSYLMIDPHGRFFQNSLERKGYDYSDPIIEVGVAKALSQIEFDEDRFLARYRETTPSK